MQSHNLFSENAKANETLAFIKADPNFTSDRTQIDSAPLNEPIVFLIPANNEVYAIDVFQRIIHAVSNPMTGNVTFYREEKKYQIKINNDGNADILTTDGNKTNLTLDEFVFNQRARALISEIKRGGFYQCVKDTHCNKAVFNRAIPQDSDNKKNIRSVGIEIYPSGHFWYVVTYNNHTEKRPHRLSTRDLDDIDVNGTRLYHEKVIAPLIETNHPQTESLNNHKMN